MVPPKRTGLHVLGQPPTAPQLLQYLQAYFAQHDLPLTLLQDVADGADAATNNPDALRQRLERAYQLQPAAGSTDPEQNIIEEAIRISQLLQQNTQEMESILRALDGEYILPEAGGDLLRDGAGVLPTGRNIYALDPYRMPSTAAMARGEALAHAIIEQHRGANEGMYPETIAVNLWGLDAIKTKGESVAIALTLVGARPVREGTGRIARFELIPLQQLGRPRIDVLCNMSGIFRDAFPNVVELLDDMFQRAATADESVEMNYIKKHAQAITEQGQGNGAARLFSNPAGDFGSFVNEQVGAGSWSDGAELGETWIARNAFSYGRGKERGTARAEVLRALLATTDRVVQQVDSVEYGLTDIQEYYANTGALRKAAQAANPGATVGCTIVEAFEQQAKPRELEDVLRLEYRSKLLNPKWAAAMASQGSGGAYEISQRMTAMIGWGATAEFKDEWVYDQAAERYALDKDMADTLRRNNPEAFGNVLRRLLEAAGRGMWSPDAATIKQLQRMYDDLDAELEGVA